jgi:hypothetical protein
LHLVAECRFEEDMSNLESSLVVEKQQHEASVVELAEAREKIIKLQTEVGNTDEKSTLLQTTIQRFSPFSLLLYESNLLNKKTWPVGLRLPPRYSIKKTFVTQTEKIH